jgi:hypothetical protein
MDLMANPENSSESVGQIRSATGAASEAASAPMWRWLGYALLLLSLFDTLESAIPVNLMNPEWELQFMGSVIERSPVPLLGFVFVMFAEHLRRTRWSRSVAQGVSWAALVAGLGLILMVPLIVANTFRMETRAAAQVKTQLDQQLAQTQDLEAALTSATGDTLADMLRRLGKSAEGSSAEEKRQEVLGEVAKARQAMQIRADEALASQKLTMAKRSYKWAAQAVAVGALLVYVWWSTGWLRRAKR